MAKLLCNIRYKKADPFRAGFVVALYQGKTPCLLSTSVFIILRYDLQSLQEHHQCFLVI